MFTYCRVILFTLALSLATPAYAAQTVVEPEAYAPDTQSAQNKVFATGEKMALYQILYPHVQKKAENIVLGLSPGARQKLITGFDILKEVRRGTYYRAQIRYEVDDELLKRLLKNYQAQVGGDAQSQAIMILPVLDIGTGLDIWGEINPWRDAIHRAALQEGEGKVVVPNGDMEDLKLVDMAVVLSGNAKVLGDLAHRYGARSLMIAMAKPLTAQKGYQVVLRKAGESKDEEKVQRYLPEDENETAEQVLLRAARHIAAFVRKSSANYGAFLETGESSGAAKVLRAEYRNNREWVQIKDILTHLPGVQKVNIDAVAPDYAVMTMYYHGTPEVIRSLMQTRGVHLRQMGKYWTVSVR